MVKLKVYDAFETKKAAQKTANQIKRDGVQFVRIRRMSGRLKYGVFLGGRRSSIYV